ncbi:unnamed protein product [Miscanthus lutarioriparius]|uniref:Uncharacterized protein n=1 Tax=Miscanthus lutarioriparius TaxID=422564 RepID=A0A811MDP2_9POAL|nr:unnamed protein product [Miscanthus lutarioriparius]
MAASRRKASEQRSSPSSSAASSAATTATPRRLLRPPMNTNAASTSSPGTSGDAIPRPDHRLLRSQGLPKGKGAGAQANKDAAQAKSADHQSGKEAVKPKAKTLDEMRELYPYLVDEATVLVEPAVLESVLLGIENSDAQALDKKIRKARKQLAKAITESARINNIEMPTVFMFTSSKLQPEKLRVENENNLLVDHLDKTDDVDSCTKQRLASVEREVVELRQAVIASQSQPKGIRCESAKSGLQSIVAENQTPANIYKRR